jgi:hypothetical protein
MEPGTFHSFSRLPKELRDTIWDLAVRPAVPSAHIFTVFDSSNDVEWSELSQNSMKHLLAMRCSLAAPHTQTMGHHQRQCSWVEANRSTYMIDSGLWTACKESRDALERRFMVSKWDIKREEAGLSGDRERKDLHDAPATGSFHLSGKSQRCLTHPKSDLFLLQPFEAETIDWEYLPSSVPIFDYCEGFCVGHIAIAYDPQWLAHGEYLPADAAWFSPGTVGCAIRAATDQLYWAENLWFVDYRIRRRSGMSRSTASRYRFQGNGCTFTEVREGDMDWELDHTQDVFRFLEELREATRLYLTRNSPSPDGRGGYHVGVPQAGILAYEEWWLLTKT